MKIIYILIVSIFLCSCISSESGNKENDDKINSEELKIDEVNNIFNKLTTDNNSVTYYKDTIDYNAIKFSDDSLDLALFNLIAEHNDYSEDKLIENIEILINKGANPNAVIEYKYSVRKVGTYIPIIKHFYRNKYRTISANSTSFLEAVNSDKYRVVEKMILLKANVNSPSKSSVFPIDLAIKNDNEKIIDLLVANECNVANANLSLSKNIYLIEKLVKLGADKNTIDINFALEDITTLKRILNLKPDINNYELDYRIIFANEEILDLLLEAGLNNSSRGSFPDDNPLIMGAIKYGDINTIKKLDIAGIDIMYSGERNTSDKPFLNVIKSQKIELIKYYIEQGADLNEKDWTKKSALIIAVNTDNDEIIKILINAGANKEYSGYFGKTPLMQAVDYDNYISAQALINEGANVNFKNKYGETCLMLAIEKHNFAMIKLLVENGANSKAMYKKMNMTEYAKSVDAPNMIIEYIENIE